ncbi:MAG: AmmeMemoRadiSam system radical SAM enzyme [Planctomycetota bacterium]|nr:AmmeMemoRadiSam system radical SAM enzyme [Planctomycetota bacterium]
MRESQLYEKLDAAGVRCGVCPHRCRIAPGKTGICRQRKNVDGALFLLNYAHVSSICLDPIEKKPLYHFFPGSDIMSAGSVGCNFACPFCQNYSISQVNSHTHEVTPQQLVDAANREKSIGIAYTYNEPLIWLEYVLDTARLARDAGLKNLLVTNGYTTPEAYAKLAAYVDALNVDIKSIDDAFYKRLCKASLKPVLDLCVEAHKTAHVEITNLVIPGENDSDGNFAELAKWIRQNLGHDTPLHFSAYYPTYKMTNPPTQAATLIRARKIAKDHLDFVYVGNVSVPEGNNTNCRKCGSLLVERRGYSVKLRALDEAGKCGQCGEDNRFVAR